MHEVAAGSALDGLVSPRSIAAHIPYGHSDLIFAAGLAPTLESYIEIQIVCNQVDRLLTLLRPADRTPSCNEERLEYVLVLNPRLLSRELDDSPDWDLGKISKIQVLQATYSWEDDPGPIVTDIR